MEAFGSIQNKQSETSGTMDRTDQQDRTGEARTARGRRRRREETGRDPLAVGFEPLPIGSNSSEVPFQDHDARFPWRTLRVPTPRLALGRWILSVGGDGSRGGIDRLGASESQGTSVGCHAHQRTLRQRSTEADAVFQDAVELAKELLDGKEHRSEVRFVAVGSQAARHHLGGSCGSFRSPERTP